MSGAQLPPHLVPTLTEVVDVGAGDGTVVAAATVEAAAVQNVLKHIDMILENRLQEAVGKLVFAHSQTLAAQLREEIAEVVHQCMAKALNQASQANAALKTPS